MAIEVTCACGKRLSVKEELAGKRGKCPACGATLVIPAPAPIPAALNAGLPQPTAPVPVSSPAPSAAAETKPKSAPFLCPRCGTAMQKTLTVKSFLTQLALGLTAGFYFVPTAPFKCLSCEPIRYDELSPEESYRAQEVISAKGCFKLGCAVTLGGFVLICLVGYVLNLFGIKMK